MNNWSVSEQGFITDFMVSGPKAVPYYNDKKDTNQIRYEAYLRSVIAEHEPVGDLSELRIGESSRLGMPWNYYYYYGSSFVDVSTFYSLMNRVVFDAATVLIAPEDMEISAVLWSYAAVDLYCNGICIGTIASPVYKPIQKREVVLPLKKGRNSIYLACENLGVRDTRSVVGLQLVERAGEIEVTLPDEGHARQVRRSKRFLDTIVLENDRLSFETEAAEGTAYVYPEAGHGNGTFAGGWISAAGQREILLEEGKSLVSVKTETDGIVMKRLFERTDQIRPVYNERELTFEENCNAIYRRIAAVKGSERGEGIVFSINHILARKYLNESIPEDDRLLEDTLRLIDSRVDCSDFLMCGLIRYLHNYPVEGAMKEKVRSTLLNYRYWMDMEGFDGMCFWSENHALMFYASAMHAGELYPDEYFPRAKYTGKELAAYGRDKVIQWLDDMETYGCEEFLSTVYMCVTFGALLNVIDYSEKAICDRAAAVTDRLLRELAMHTFKNGILAPMGRVYRNVLYPFGAGAMSLMNLIDPKLPYSGGDWLIFCATSRYRIPREYAAWMTQKTETSYVSGNARIMLEKNDAYCLTSVLSPREPFVRWENETFREDADTSGHSYTKSFNERFHGTTCFQPGVYGYQQHMWYAALDGEAAVFVNHPGSTCEDGDMRPGYWHGNGQMPAVKQQHGMIGSIYCISEKHPIHFTHLYCPECRFEQVKREGRWLFLKKGGGCLAIWCSGEMEDYNGRNFRCEKRVYADRAAWFVYASEEKESGGFEAFQRKAKALCPAYDPAANRLTAEGYELIYEPCEDKTQYL